LILAGSATGLVLLLAFFTNPSQAAHLRAIRETATAGKTEYQASTIQVSGVLYNNYGIFSTTTFWGMDTLTYGYFGQVQTTNDIYKAAH
jgi:hypothetical protein